MNSVSYPNYLDIRQRATSFDPYVFQPVAQSASLGSSSGAERVFVNFVSPNYFSVLGAHPRLGQFFAEDDGRRVESSPVVVLSHDFWKRRLNQNQDAIGQTLQLNGRAFTVIGVTPEGFQGTNIVGTDIWMPVGMVGVMQNPVMIVNRAMGWLMMGGRLKPGVSRTQAAAELDAITGALELEYPNENQGKSLRLTASSVIPNEVILPVSGFLSLLMVIVSLVLVIACANVASVLLARGAARRREIAVRLAIGAGRGRLLRQLSAETALLFLLGGAGGLLAARAMTSMLLSLLPALPVPVELSLGLDARVVVFTIGLSLISALLCGLAPALQSSKTDVVSSLKDESSGMPMRARLRQAFVVGQIALSIVLVVAAGLFIRALQKASSIDLGFDPRNVEIVSLDLELSANSAIVGQVSELELIRRITTSSRLFSAELVERVRRLPGVRSASQASSLPMGEVIARMGGVRVPGIAGLNGTNSFESIGNVVDVGYFETMGIRLISGRDFTASDNEGSAPVAIVGEAFARKFWPGDNAVGKSFILELPAAPGISNLEKTMTIVGVARDLKYTGLRDDAQRLFVYASLLQQVQSGGHPNLVVRSDGRRLAGSIRTLIGSMNPNALILAAKPLDDNIALNLLPQRLAASIAGSLGIVGILLAAIGIYGVTAYSVTQRTREIGIRVALGARRAEVIRMVLRQGMLLVAAGSLIGLTIAAAGSQLLRGLLFGVPPMDPLTYGAAAILQSVIGLTACFAPVRRATQISAMEALRHE